MTRKRKDLSSCSGAASSGEILGAVGRQRIVPGWARLRIVRSLASARVVRFRRHDPIRAPRSPFVRECLARDLGGAAQ